MVVTGQAVDYSDFLDADVEDPVSLEHRHWQQIEEQYKKEGFNCTGNVPRLNEEQYDDIYARLGFDVRKTPGFRPDKTIDDKVVRFFLRNGQKKN